jgi:hypothetical protein
MNDIDKITLELFTNKTHYKKYLSKIEPDNYNEIKEEAESINYYQFWNGSDDLSLGCAWEAHRSVRE